eukprot:TRINITY_DN49205_c0_g1_i1.p1 TRINITY_DN49205_c0_g1~~TRINITY_DN49205_c0_g1_i1.p1  ORF type:complete len:542 (+),score=47.12 TRINITY_DN49205_c0_g1_i1:57-1682(+)
MKRRRLHGKQTVADLAVYEGPGLRRKPANARGHYDVLGIPNTASPAEIRSAFKQRALICHPDKGGPRALFEELKKAYEVLIDPKQRKQYDIETRRTWSSDGDGTACRQAAPPRPDDAARLRAGDARVLLERWLHDPSEVELGRQPLEILLELQRLLVRGRSEIGPDARTAAHAATTSCDGLYCRRGGRSEVVARWGGLEMTCYSSSWEQGLEDHMACYELKKSATSRKTRSASQLLLKSELWLMYLVFPTVSKCVFRHRCGASFTHSSPDFRVIMNSALWFERNPGATPRAVKAHLEGIQLECKQSVNTWQERRTQLLQALQLIPQLTKLADRTRQLEAERRAFTPATSLLCALQLGPEQARRAARLLQQLPRDELKRRWEQMLEPPHRAMTDQGPIVLDADVLQQLPGFLLLREMGPFCASSRTAREAACEERRQRLQRFSIQDAASEMAPYLSGRMRRRGNSALAKGFINLLCQPHLARYFEEVDCRIPCGVIDERVTTALVHMPNLRKVTAPRAGWQSTKHKSAFKKRLTAGTAVTFI